MNTLRKTGIALILMALHYAAPLALAADGTTAHPFTVADSIQMTTFSDPYTRDSDATAKESPDHRGFIVVTTRGLLSQNLLESSLWYFSRTSIEHFLQAGMATPPKPRLLYRRTGRIVSFQLNSYGSLISDAHWTDDSRSILVIVEQTGGRRHLVRIDVASSHSADLTPDANGEIRSATKAAATTAYLEQPAASTVDLDVQTGAEVVRTGQTLFHILAPEEFPNGRDIGGDWKLRIKPVDAGATSFFIEYPAAAAFTFRPAISADGKTIIIAVPVKDVPPSWVAYRSGANDFHFYPFSHEVDRTGKAYEWPWEYALLDLSTRKVRPLWEAPVAWISGYGNVEHAEWSPTGREFLVTNTYLPFNSEQQVQPNTIKPCAVAVFTLSSLRATCVVESRYPDSIEYLREAHFGSDGEHIVTRWTSKGNVTTTTYEGAGGSWKATLSSHNSLSPDSALKLIVKQDLTVPPTLWAVTNNGAKRLWNPNPQLDQTTFAKGQVIHWKDDSGYEWRGALLTPPGVPPRNGYPLVIQTHGFYNEHEFMPDGAFTTGFAAQPLACAGIAVLQMEDRSDRYLHPSTEESELSAAGYTSAVDYLVNRGFADPSRVGIIGFSRTHWYVERALEVAPHYFRAATLIDGVDQSYVTDVLFGPGRAGSIREHEEANGGKPFGGGLTTWTRHAVGFNLDKIDAPVRLEAIGQTSLLGEWETYSMLSQQGKPVDLVQILHGQHILQNPQDRYASQQGNVDWFRFWLEGVERESPHMRMQYSRWRRLESLLLHK